MKDKMSKSERETAERIVTRAMKAAQLLDFIHADCESLIDDGWDLDGWEIARAAMSVGRVGLEVAHTIGIEDGWAKEEVMV